MGLPLQEPSSVPSLSSEVVHQKPIGDSPHFGELRGLQWRINLGVLPSSASASIDELRRATAGCRRRYANLRRRLLVDPHVPKDGSGSSDLVMDNPLSQNPDSTWGRFFQNAELEKMVDQDLSRLYPEHGTYFQTPGCQGMLRRILLLWCLRHPEYGYRQGIHELLAPLLYVLQVDLECLSEVRKLYENHFTDKFDGLLFQDNDLSYSFDFRNSPRCMPGEVDSHGNGLKVNTLDELDPEIKTIVLLSDAYGAEGELGIVLSEKFIEHDAYCMFDALMNGAHGAVAVGAFFSSSPEAISHTGLPPVIESSAALYHLLFLVDSSLHDHLVDLGVEPQYFSLRWLRVLFGREFSLGNLLIVWDEIFASDNSARDKGNEDVLSSSFRILDSPRGAFISAMAVSMLLYLRSSLLASENATVCLRRLLNFPENVDMKKLLQMANSLKTIALNANTSLLSPLCGGSYNQSKPATVRCQSLPSEPVSPTTPLSLITESYWEEKWRNLHEAEERGQGGQEKQVPTRKTGWTEKVKCSSKRLGSDPSPPWTSSEKKEIKASVRRNLLEDLSRQLGLEEEDIGKEDHQDILGQQGDLDVATIAEEQEGNCVDNNVTAEDESLSRNSVIEDNSSVCSEPSTPFNGGDDHGNDHARSSVASSSSVEETHDHPHTAPSDSPLPVSDLPDIFPHLSEPVNDPLGTPVTSFKEKKNPPSKFHWFWKFGLNGGEDTSDKGGPPEAIINSVNSSPSVNGHCGSFGWKGDAADQTMIGTTFKNLGQSMIEHIQVIESVFPQDLVQSGGSRESFCKNVLVGKGQVTAITALKELRKISNLLSDM